MVTVDICLAEVMQDLVSNLTRTVYVIYGQFYKYEDVFVSLHHAASLFPCHTTTIPL